MARVWGGSGSALSIPVGPVAPDFTTRTGPDPFSRSATAGAVRRFRARSLAIVLACWTGLVPAESLPIPPPVESVAGLAQGLLASYRKVIVLVDGDDALSPAERERITLVGRIIYHEQLAKQEHLATILLRAVSADKAEFERFLDWLETAPELRDADKLAFRDTLSEIDAAVREGTSTPGSAFSARLTEDRRTLDEIQARYEKEITKIVARVGERGVAQRRESWESYLAHLRTLFRREAILDEYDADQSLLPPSRGGLPVAAASETNGRQFPAKTVLLTFDDGPHPRHTERILEVLRKYDVGSVFFQVGRHLGRVDKKGNVELGGRSDISKRLAAAGAVIANHTYTHPVLPKSKKSDIDVELASTSALLKKITGTVPVLFRAPYGARNDAVLDELTARKMRSIMWNVDSRDWADPIPRSIANRVLEEVAREGRGIILFHDVHERTIEALELVLQQLKGEGFRFAAWNGKDFVAPLVTAAAAPAEPPKALYRNSWAVVIGIDEYEKWPKLRYAVNDARAVRDLLISKYRFKPGNVFTLYNGEATRKNILSLLGDTLGDAAKIQRDDRVFVFYAGHGATRQLASGRDLGYIVPVEADLANYHGGAISMTSFRDVAEAIPARHLFFVMDSCYSGLGLTRGAGAASSMPDYLQQLTRRAARQILTAGGADQQVADNGPNGHSVFTWTLLQALDGRGDLNNDGFITASELAAYTVPLVASLAPQTPAFGSLPGSEGGEFIFELSADNEFLSDLSAQLDDQGVQLNTRLEKLRAEVMQKHERNRKLKSEIAAAERELSGIPVAPETPLADTATTRNNRGLALYKNRKYEEAVQEFLAAARIDPSDAQAANNVGFVYFKLGRFEESARWLERTIMLDPKRAVAYRNLGDAYEKLDRLANAKRMYLKYLTLNPPPASASAVQEKLATMP
jgi:peptidoglycan/xylan/chitin deacetylase (PgdA/CDA1 family)/tetratricopeptide (TPR) repeat protein